MQRAILGVLVGCSLTVSGLLSPSWAQSDEDMLQLDRSNVWRDGLGQGFSRGTFQTGFSLGGGFGNAAFGSWVAHDLALASVNAGWILSDVVAPDRWYRGNWEFLGELFSGAQFHPQTRYVAGLTPLLRYNFATGTRWVPFLTAGAGACLTDIGRPDLSGTFQFDPQGGVGTHYFFSEDTALTLEYRWLHISNASIQQPNHGVNTQMFLAGIAWFF